MASISTDAEGRKRILFLDADDDRKAIWLGRMPDRQVSEIKTKVESIVAAAIADSSLDPATVDWLGRIKDNLHTKLAKVGLVAPRKPPEPPPAVRLGDFLDAYIAGRTDAKRRTRLNLGMFRDRLTAFFGADRDLTTIKSSDADAWVIYLKANYAVATVGRTIKGARQFFKAACRAEIIDRNPFEDLKAGSYPDKERQRFISQADTLRVLESCPDAEWRLLIALSRFGGLRCPSEHLALTWPDVDWERERFWVRSSKTAHHEGKEGRWVPLFPELRPYLQEAWDLAAEGTVHVITRYRDACANLRTQFTRIIRKAGLTPWPLTARQRGLHCHDKADRPCWSRPPRSGRCCRASASGRLA
jgi:integrase